MISTYHPICSSFMSRSIFVQCSVHFQLHFFHNSLLSLTNVPRNHFDELIMIIQCNNKVSDNVLDFHINCFFSDSKMLSHNNDLIPARSAAATFLELKFHFHCKLCMLKFFFLLLSCFCCCNCRCTWKCPWTKTSFRFELFLTVLEIYSSVFVGILQGNYNCSVFCVHRIFFNVQVQLHYQLYQKNYCKVFVGCLNNF